MAKLLDFQIDVIDLLKCAARISGSAMSHDVLAGYLDAYEGEDQLGESTEYLTGYFLCNRSAITLGERQVEILAVISAIAMAEQKERG